MGKPIKAFIYGLGTTGRMTAAYLKEKGVEVVAAYVRTLEGEDFSAPELAGVQICQPDVPFERFGADILFSTHCSTLADLRAPALAAAAAGLDVITIAEDAFDPFYEDAATPLARELEAAFLKAGKTLASVGVQDTFWFAQPMAFSAAAQSITRIIGRNLCDLRVVGTAGGHAKQLGITAEEFTAAGLETSFTAHGRGIFEVALRPLLRGLGLEIDASFVTAEPVIASVDLSIPEHGLEIKAGTSRGIMERVRFTLTGGIIAEGQFLMAYPEPGEGVYNEWIIEGTPSMNMRTDNFHGDVITVASMLNRIPDVIAAAPGFLSVDQLPAPRYRSSLLPSPLPS